MSSRSRNDEGSDPQEAAEEEELLKLEEEVQQMAQKILEYRTTLPGQLSSTISSLLESQRPALPAHLLNTPSQRLLETGSKADVSQGLMRETMALPASEYREEAEKVQLLKQKISTNASALPAVLNRMKEYMARVDKLESSNGVIHPAFKRQRIS